MIIDNMSPSKNFNIINLSFIKALIDAGGRVFEVGGTVRNSLLNIPNKDQDIVVTLLPYTTINKLLSKFGNTETVGKSFGVIKFFPKENPEEEFDIALPRKEVSTGVGHKDFEVDFDPKLPIEIDLSRRDFTINAMAREIGQSQIIDPFGGTEDLQQKQIRMVSDKAFEEDPLRMIRGIQFAARLRFTIEEKTLESMKQNAARIKTVSPERISEEIRKLFLAEKPSTGFIFMRDTGLLREIFPELHENVGVKQLNKGPNDDVFLHTMRVLDSSRKDNSIPLAGDLDLMLAALFHDVGKARTQKYDAEKNRMTFFGHQILSKRMARKRMNFLKMTTIGVNVDDVGHLVEHHMFQTKSFFSDKSIRRFINKIGPDHILKLVDLRIADNRGGKYPDGIKGVLKLRRRIEVELSKKQAFAVKDLLVNGHDLMELGIPAGPQLGKILQALLLVVVDEPEKNTKEVLLELAKNYYENGIPIKENEEEKEEECETC